MVTPGVEIECRGCTGEGPAFAVGCCAVDRETCVGGEWPPEAVRSAGFDVRGEPCRRVGEDQFSARHAEREFDNIVARSCEDAPLRRTNVMAEAMPARLFPSEKTWRVITLYAYSAALAPKVG